MHTKSYKYPLLNDSAWLRREYVESLKSTRVIACTVGCGPNSVRQALIRHNIPVRSVSAGLLCTNAHINIDRCVVDGGLLGDACLIRDVHLPFRRSKCNSGVGFRISLAQSHAQQFYSYIGECPVDSLRYKWR